MTNSQPEIEIFKPGDFEPERHFYPKVLNSQMHPMVSYFLNMPQKNIIDRYTHLNPLVSKNYLTQLLETPNRYFYWGGSDLFYVTTESGERKMIVLETNSCPSGQKSMPLSHTNDELRGYRQLIESSFIPSLRKKRLPEGKLAVFYDKNYMEASGYASAIAELTGEEVYLIPVFNKQNHQHIFTKNNIIHINIDQEEVPIRAALRYVTQKPWNRLPIHTNTFIYNSTLVCLSGGRNKLLASKAYELFNSELYEQGLTINTPETIRDVNKVEIPLWVQKFGGYAVVKDPYSNAGQGVFTITSDSELEQFMNTEHDYDQFIVQSLIGHYEWSSTNDKGKFYHIGTMPSKKGEIFVADLRMMIYSSPQGLAPCAIYARRARSPLHQEMAENTSSWEMLGTNLSVKINENQWESETNRLMQMDNKDFNAIGIGLDDLIEGFIQTVLSIRAIDKMAIELVNKKGRFRKKLFSSLDNDPSLISEIVV